MCCFAYCDCWGKLCWTPLCWEIFFCMKSFQKNKKKLPPKLYSRRRNHTLLQILVLFSSLQPSLTPVVKKWSPPKWFAEISQHNNNNTKIGPVWQPAPDTILIMLLYCTGKLWAVWFTMDTLGCNFTSLHFLLLRMFLTACVCRPEEAPGSASVIEISATTMCCSFPQGLMIDDLVDQ